MQTQDRISENEIDKKITEIEKALKKERHNQVLVKLVDLLYNLCITITFGNSGEKLFPYQEKPSKRIIESVLLNDGARITMLFSRQSGKTESICVVIVGLAIVLPKLAQVEALCEIVPALREFRNGFWVGVFAPVLEQANTLFRRVRGRINSKTTKFILADPDINDAVITSNGGRCEFSSGSYIEVHSASPNANIESKTYHLAITDEAQDIEETKINKSISPMLTWTNGTMVMSGTPNTIKSAFWKQITVNKSAAAAGFAVTNHFEYDYLVVRKHNPRYYAYCEKMKADIGEESDEFQQAYCLQWLFVRGMFVTHEILLRKVYVNKYNLGDWHKFRGWSVAAGLDLGKSQDSTVLTLGVVDWRRPVMVSNSIDDALFRCAVVELIEIFGDDWDSQYYQLYSALVEHHAQKLVCDATGVGAGICDRFTNTLMSCEVEEFVFSGPQKSDGYKNFAKYISREMLWFPYGNDTQRDRRFKQYELQMESLTKEWRGGNLVCEKPSDIKHSHDDYPDSNMLFCWAAKRAPETAFIEASEETIYSSGGSRTNDFLR